MTNDSKSQIMTGRGDTEEPKVSRRDLFQQMVRGAAAVGAGAVSAMAMFGSRVVRSRERTGACHRRAALRCTLGPSSDSVIP